MSRRRAVIIGAGPAGLTAAYELATRTDIEPIVLEADRIVGGISRTVPHRGNRIDIGGHRFFSKSERVLQWWLHMLPLQKLDQNDFAIHYQGKLNRIRASDDSPDAEKTDDVMLLRPRRSRIYHSGEFFDYPLTLTGKTLRSLGTRRAARILLSYLRSMAFPLPTEQNLEQFLVNRFGWELYRTFFQSYTEKVWGVPCRQISAEWGAQRIKGLSVGRAVRNAFDRLRRKSGGGLRDDVETSLIEHFLYPKFGPGQMWETCEARVGAHGGRVLKGQRVHRIVCEGTIVKGVITQDTATREDSFIAGDYFFSTMPIRDLIRGLGSSVPHNVRAIGEGLVYRDFVTIGLLLSEMKIHDATSECRYPSDNWIYIQDPSVQMGRLQIFNNWSPAMVAEPGTVWVGLEYFCNEGDKIWSLPDDEIVSLGIRELTAIGFIDRSAVLDSVAIRMPKTYPAYFGTYDRLDDLRAWTDQIDNLFLIGRNGMHRYNNQDHSMLTAMVAVDCIAQGRTDKSIIWDVNTEEAYHESKS